MKKTLFVIIAMIAAIAGANAASIPDNAEAQGLVVNTTVKAFGVDVDARDSYIEYTPAGGWDDSES